MGYRKTVIATNEIYHIYNRGVEKRPIFLNKRDYSRFVKLVNYYQCADYTVRFSHFNRLKQEEKQRILEKLDKSLNKIVEVLTFCLMPNHFHLLLKQLQDSGISKFMARVTNGYSHYFNTKNKRTGHLFQGNFGAVRVETDEQLVHVSRYIHLNPVTSYLIEIKNLERYGYSSYPEYTLGKRSFCNTSEILSFFKDIKSYKKFVEDQVDYARTLENIKHLALED